MANKQTQIDFFGSDFIEEVITPAAIAAAEVIAEQVERNLQQHRSDRTGTSAKQSGRIERTEKALADSVAVSPTQDGAVVYIEDDNHFKGVWLEYGFIGKEWGAGRRSCPRTKTVHAYRF